VSVIDLATVKSHLDPPSGTNLGSSYDADLQLIINGAQTVLEGLIGPLTAQSFTESHDGGGYAIITKHTPLIAVQSLTENWGATQYTLTNQPIGSSTDAYGYDIDDAQSGKIVRRTVGGFPFPFFAGIGNVVITYTAGRTDLPADIEMALMRQIRDLWSDYQSGRTTGRGASQRQALPYGVSNYVADLLQPHILPPGIA
jgi:hypothetical protein